MSQAPLEVRLQPYQTLIQRAQEILFGKRPVVCVLLALGIFSMFTFVSETNSGFFATIAFIACVIYSVLIVFRIFGDKIDQFLFKPLEPETDPAAPDRVRSLEEICQIIESLNFGKFCSQVSGVKAGIAFLAQAVLFKVIPTFYFNALLVTVVLCLPWTITRKPVWDVVSPYFAKEKPKQE